MPLFKDLPSYSCGYRTVSNSPHVKFAHFFITQCNFIYAHYSLINLVRFNQSALTPPLSKTYITLKCFHDLQVFNWIFFFRQTWLKFQSWILAIKIPWFVTILEISSQSNNKFVVFGKIEVIIFAYLIYNQTPQNDPCIMKLTF